MKAVKIVKFFISWNCSIILLCYWHSWNLSTLLKITFFTFLSLKLILAKKFYKKYLLFTKIHFQLFFTFLHVYSCSPLTIACKMIFNFFIPFLPLPTKETHFLSNSLPSPSSQFLSINYFFHQKVSFFLFPSFLTLTLTLPFTLSLQPL